MPTKLFCRVLVTVLSAMLVAAPALRAEAMASTAAGNVRGTVTYTSGDALAGVAVRLVDIDTARVIAESVTGEAGTVVFPEVAYGTYHLAVVAPDGFIAVPTGLVTVSAATPVVGVEATVVQTTEAAALEGQVNAVLPNGVTIAGVQVTVGPGTAFTGPLNSLPAIQAALDEGKKVCAEYVGSPDEPLTAVTLFAEICDDDAAALLILGLLGAGFAGYAISQIGGGGGVVEVVTQ